jgi:hypothetical protein
MNQCMQAADQVGIKQVPWLKRKMTDDQGGPSSKRMSSQGNVEPSAVAAAPHHVPILPRPASSSAEITPAPTPAPPPAPPATGPKKKGRPSRADRAKLRPILPQSIAPRPPVEQNQGTQLASQSSNQSNDQLVHQPVHQPVHQSSNQIATQSNNQLANQSSNQPAIQSNNQLAKQPVNQFAKQSSNQLANQFQTNQTTQGPAVPRTISPQSLDAARLLDMNNYSTSYTGTPGGGTKLEGASPQDEASRPVSPMFHLMRTVLTGWISESWQSQCRSSSEAPDLTCYQAQFLLNLSQELVAMLQEGFTTSLPRLHPCSRGMPTLV